MISNIRSKLKLVNLVIDKSFIRLTFPQPKLSSKHKIFAQARSKIELELSRDRSANTNALCLGVLKYGRKQAKREQENLVVTHIAVETEGCASPPPESFMINQQQPHQASNSKPLFRTPLLLQMLRFRK